MKASIGGCLLCLALCSLCHAQLSVRIPRSKYDLTKLRVLKRPDLGSEGEKSGVVRELKKSAEDFVVDDGGNESEDISAVNPRFVREIAMYENHLSLAPFANELVEEGGAWENSEPEIVIHEIHDLTTTTASTTSTTSGDQPTKTTTVVYTVAAAPNVLFRPLDEFRPLNSPSSANDKIDTPTKWTSLSSGSVYVALPHPKRECKGNSECYGMREPDEWCQSVARSDQTFERGCFCDHGSSFCLVERLTANGYEYTDCFPKADSKCEV